MIPNMVVCLWFIARDKRNSRFRDRRGETLFIDARKLGKLKDRVHRDLEPEDIARMADIYHAWRGDRQDLAKLPLFASGEVNKVYEDIPGFCKSATIHEISQHGYVLTPGRYVGAAEEVLDEEPFEVKTKRLIETLDKQFEESARLEKQIRENLRWLDLTGSNH